MTLHTICAHYIVTKSACPKAKKAREDMCYVSKLQLGKYKK